MLGLVVILVCMLLSIHTLRVNATFEDLKDGLVCISAFLEFQPQTLPGSGVSECDEEEAEDAPSSLMAAWDRLIPRPGGSFIPSCSAISTWSPGWM